MHGGGETTTKLGSMNFHTQALIHKEIGINKLMETMFKQGQNASVLKNTECGNRSDVSSSGPHWILW